MFIREQNCSNCFFQTFRKCLRGEDGQLLDPREVDQIEGCDEYDFCSGWLRAEENSTPKT